MQVFYFAPSDRQIFGAYHEPASVNAFNQRSVVICPSIVEEYETTRWSMLRLANLLADGGFHVLRFDYAGTGDSAGELSAVDASIWIENTATAAEEVRGLTGNQRVALVGFRIGALLAAAAARDASADALVAFEPLWNGEEFLRLLREADRRRRLKRRQRLADSSPDDNPQRLTGYPLSEACIESLRALELPSCLGNADCRIELVTSANDPRLAELADSRQASLRVSAGESSWLERLNQLMRVHVPNGALETVRDALTAK